MTATIQSRTLPLERLNIRCLTAGESGSPVLLLHGGGIDSAALSWRFALTALAQNHRVFAPDWPGYGESDKPQIEYTTEYFVTLLGRLMDALGLARASLVGISMGGAIALGFTLRSPGRVERLALVDSYGLQSHSPFPTFSYLLVRLPLINELAWKSMGWSRRLARWTLRYVMHDPQTISPALVDEVYRVMQQPETGRAFRSWQKSEVLRDGLRTNFINRLHEISAPTLLLHGAHDRLVPLACSQEAVARLPNAQLRIFPTCGHWPPREQPDQFNRALAAFLDPAPA